MDPLASAITVVTSLRASVQTALRLWEAPAELRSLSAELTKLQTIGGTLVALVRHRQLRSDVETALANPYAELQNAQVVFDQYFLTGPGVSEWHLRRQWARHRLHLRRLSRIIQNVQLDFIIAGVILIAACSTDLDSFARSSSFNPEKYVTNSRLNEPLTVISFRHLRRTASVRVDKIFALFIRDARHWSRITVMVTTQLQHRPWEAQLLETYRAGSHWQVLPGQIQKQLLLLLQDPQLKLYSSVTSIHIKLKQNDHGDPTFDIDDRHIAEDVEEARKDDTSEAVQEVRQRCLPAYRESEVLVYKRTGPLLYLAGIGSRLHLQRRLLFAEAAGAGRNLVSEFLADMRLRLRIESCESVVKFAGVVLSDDHKKLCGYLVEVPERGALKEVLAKAVMSGIHVSWRRRLKWIRQVITALSQIHRKGCEVGVLNVHNVWLDSSDNAVLMSFNAGGTNFQRPGFTPPEYRWLPSEHGGLESDKPIYILPLRQADVKPSGHAIPVSTYSDIFQLGMFVWMLAEHLPTTIGVFCPKHRCSAVPRYRCRKEHAEPVALPRCQDVPVAINEIVQRCRRTEPATRPSAGELLALLPPLRVDTGLPLGKSDPLDIFSQNYTCSECGTVVFDELWHCDICQDGDFDLCRECFTNGILCYNTDHQIGRRICERQSWINV